MFQGSCSCPCVDTHPSFDSLNTFSRSSMRTPRSRSNNTLFPVGSDVEVSSDVDGFNGAWFTAKVIEPPPPTADTPSPKRKTKRDLFVEYQTLLSDDSSQLLTEFVEPVYVRPLPPLDPDGHVFEVNDVVDAFHLDGWWMGVVMKVWEESGTYSVWFEDPHELLDLKRSELRTHWDWAGRKWVRPRKKKIQPKDGESGSQKRKRSMRKRPSIKGSEDASAKKAAKLSYTGCTTGGAEMAIVESPGNMTDVPISMQFDELSPSTVSIEKSVKDAASSRFHSPLKKLKMDVQLKEGGTGSPKRETVHQKSLTKGKNCDGAIGAVDKLVVKDLAIVGVESSENTGDSNGGASLGEIVIKDCAITDFISPKITGGSIGSEDASAEKAAEPYDTGCGTREAEMAIITRPSNIANTYKPISTCFGGVFPLTVVFDSRFIHSGIFNQWNVPEGRLIEFDGEYTANESMSNTLPDENRGLPYVECSSILKAVESLEIFQKMPQKPHFKPLEKCKELYREGLAIGYMLTFANVVKQTLNLRVNDPRRLYKTIFEALHDLESHGFHTMAVQRRVTELQSIKERYELVKEVLREFEHVIAEQTREQTKTKEEFHEVVKQIKILEERKARLVSLMEKNDCRIAEMKLNLDVHKQDFHDIELDFASVAATRL